MDFLRKITPPLPNEKLITGTSSCKATSAFSLAPGISKVAPIPKGLSVNLRISRILFLVSSAESGPKISARNRKSHFKKMKQWTTKLPVAKMPNPPAFETAATKRGVDIQLIPGKITGYLMPSSFVTRVLTAMMDK